jgi:hypothetical protein
VGMSLDVRVWWGYDLGYAEEQDWWEDSDPPEWAGEYGSEWTENYEDELARQAGLVDPSPKDDGWSEWYAVPENRAASRAHWDAKNALLESLPEVAFYGRTGDYPGVLLALRGTEQSSYRASLRLSDLPPVDEAAGRAELDAFLTRLGLPVPEEAPGWHAAASYG